MRNHKGIIYYSDERIGEPIRSVVLDHLSRSGLPIYLSMLGNRKPCYASMVNQIASVLGLAERDVIFFAEQDVLLPRSHFAFDPPRDDTYYYDCNVWRWQFGSDKAITYDRLISLSGLCCNRELALRHFEARLEAIAKMPPEQQEQRDPYWARKWGYEPGTKPRRKGGFSDEPFDMWRSEYPIVDIRHDGCFSPKKVSLGSFRHQPTGWKECAVEDIPGWRLRELFSGRRNNAASLSV